MQEYFCTLYRTPFSTAFRPVFHNGSEVYSDRKNLATPVVQYTGCSYCSSKDNRLNVFEAGIHSWNDKNQAVIIQVLVK